MDKLRKLIKVFAILAVLLFALPAIIRLLFDGSIKRDIETVKEELRQLNTPTDLEELHAAIPNDPQLIQAATSYRKAFDAYVEPDQALRERLPSTFSQNRFDPRSESFNDVMEATATLLELNTESLRLIREAAPLGRANFQRDRSGGIAIDAPDVASLLALSELLILEAEHAAALGDTERATEALATAFQMSRALLNDPLLTAQGACIGMNVNAAHSLAEVITKIPLNIDQLNRIDVAISAEEARDDMRLTIAGETIALDITITALATGDLTPELQQMLSADNEAIRYLRFVPFATAWVHANRLELFTLTANLLRDFDNDYQTYADAMKQQEIQQEEISNILLLTKLIAPTYTKIPDLHLRDVAYLRAARSVIAVEQYRLQHDTLPDSLTQTDITDATISTDPYTGAPLIYKIEDPGYVIYSIGSDLQDDNAPQPETLEAQRQRGDWYLRVRR